MSKDQVECRLVDALRSLDLESSLKFPARILYKEITYQIKIANGHAYISQDIGAAARRMNLDIKPTNSGMAIIIRSRETLNQLCKQYGVGEDSEGISGVATS